MTKKNLRPQQVAPVQRETNATLSGEKGASASFITAILPPFAGDDAE
ncbi:MAG TPA: anacyclamide/piricyclamide family prenylated cyclic peptide [Leptolyngbyaceae cyanobacterium]